MVEANWSGKYPSLCCGKWTLIVNGIDVSNKIPEGLMHNSMYTNGNFKRYHLLEERVDYYTDGLECKEWINDNADWLYDITNDVIVMEEIFYAIKKQDFRMCSCGGCI